MTDIIALLVHLNNLENQVKQQKEALDQATRDRFIHPDTPDNNNITTQNREIATTKLNTYYESHLKLYSFFN